MDRSFGHRDSRIIDLILRLDDFRNDMAELFPDCARLLAMCECAMLENVFPAIGGSAAGIQQTDFVSTLSNLDAFGRRILYTLVLRSGMPIGALELSRLAFGIFDHDADASQLNAKIAHLNEILQPLGVAIEASDDPVGFLLTRDT